MNTGRCVEFCPVIAGKYRGILSDFILHNLSREVLEFYEYTCRVSYILFTKTKTKLHGLSPRANYTDRAKWLPTFADRGCHVVSVTDPSGRILGSLDRSRYFSFK
jgi:hypothetical protein